MIERIPCSKGDIFVIEEPSGRLVIRQAGMIESLKIRDRTELFYIMNSLLEILPDTKGRDLTGVKIDFSEHMMLDQLRAEKQSK
jgi:hypothetical protein